MGRWNKIRSVALNNQTPNFLWGCLNCLVGLRRNVISRKYFLTNGFLAFHDVSFFSFSFQFQTKTLHCISSHLVKTALRSRKHSLEIPSLRPRHFLELGGPVDKFHWSHAQKTCLRQSKHFTHTLHLLVVAVLSIVMVKQDLNQDL